MKIGLLKVSFAELVCLCFDQKCIFREVLNESIVILHKNCNISNEWLIHLRKNSKYYKI